MSTTLAQAPVAARFEHLAKVISSQRFLRREGLGSEVPFFICQYRPEEAVEFQLHTRQLGKRLESSGMHILEINLYQLSIELLKARGRWEALLKIEPTVPKAEFLEQLQAMLDPETHLIPAIAAKMAAAKGFQVLFITGVGEVFPYIRSHSILNNLQKVAKDSPSVMFFPGEYTHSLEHGAALTLFGRLHDDKYYRAFDIFHYEV